MRRLLSGRRRISRERDDSMGEAIITVSRAPRAWAWGLLLAVVFGLTPALVCAGRPISAAGGSFPLPIYQKWFEEYKAKTGVQINYQPQGSGARVQQLMAGTVDFGASDMPMTNEQLQAMQPPALHFPTVLGAVVLIYNVPGVNETLRFSPATIA